MFVGEQPGDEEDRQGLPFVGPAGRLLDRALKDAGIERESTYVTNAVKHFKFEERGKRRIHKKPNEAEIRACRPWLEAEIAVVKPRVLVCLGATASKAMFGSAYRVTQQRGQFIELPSVAVGTSTIHPSAILRAPDGDQRQIEYERFVADLRAIKAAVVRPPRLASRA
jgi:DNA polymerase